MRRGRAQDQAPPPGLAGDVIPAAAQGRPPVAGDVLRVECFSPQDQEGRIGEGVFEGVFNGLLLLRVGSRQRLAVPAVNVTRVEVRSRRTRSSVGGLIGALLGAAAGAVIGDSKSGPESSLHWTRNMYRFAGGSVGAFSGLIVGNIIGSLIKTDTWFEVPQNWVVQYSESMPIGFVQFVPRCRSLDTEAR